MDKQVLNNNDVSITTKQLAYSYPNTSTSILNQLSFTIHRGEVFGLLGPSGSGKSTTQRILMGLLPGFTGHATVFGQSVNQFDRSFYERIGVCFELPTLYLRLTALENLTLFASLYSGKTIKPMDALAMVGLEQDANKRIDAFSKGMKMRLNLCRALLNDPELLFLDEPTTGQDPARARITRELILALKDQGKTIFLTTHNMSEADEVCDRIGFLVNGRAEIVDSPAVLKQRYGQPLLEVTTQTNGQQTTQQFPMNHIGDNAEFQTLLKTGNIIAMHSQEASLDDVFIKIAGNTP